ncbi:MAG: hypothetical protein NW207_11510 [Cytophagales bacterium]|nr:hypothetical protein [Cytophagales bacterium]
MTAILHHWEIQCMHTPDVIDRILMNIRKRGMLVNSLHYTSHGDTATCIIEFEDEEASANRIHSNMLRVLDIVSINRL